MMKKLFYIFSVYMLAVASNSCSKLEEQVLDETSSTGATD